MPVHETRAHTGLSVNVGRSAKSGGEHRENIAATSDKLPKRGTTGPGTSAPAAMSPSGARYSMKKLGKPAAKLA